MSFAAAGALFYTAMIVGAPEEEPAPAEQPLLQASPGQTLSAAEELGGLIAAFPAPVLAALPDSGLRLIRGVSEDAAFEDGYGRIATLTYEDEAGRRITARTIYPARALSLLGRGGWQLTLSEGPRLAGMRTVCMAQGGRLRFHCRSAEAIYAVEMQAEDQQTAALLLQPLQLMVPAGE